MIIRGLTFSGPMAKANVQGRKTETRRDAGNRNARALQAAFDAGNDVILYQRELFRLENIADPLNPAAVKVLNFTHMPVWYEADCGAPSDRTRSKYGNPFGRKRAAFHMPKWASRAVLTVQKIWTEPLGAITNEGALAEGVCEQDGGYGLPGWPDSDLRATPRDAYFALFNRVNGRAPDAPLKLDRPVVAIRYAVSERNILAVETEMNRSGGASPNGKRKCAPVREGAQTEQAPGRARAAAVAEATAISREGLGAKDGRAA